jgi:hypothetical protein
MSLQWRSAAAPPGHMAAQWRSGGGRRGRGGAGASGEVEAEVSATGYVEEEVGRRSYVWYNDGGACGHARCFSLGSRHVC